MPVRILIADDNAVLRRAIRCLLESHREFQVCGEAEDGMQAVKKSAKLQPDVVTLNLSMPEMTGFDAARKIKEVSPRSQIVILSAHEDQRLVEEAGKVGAVCYVPKTEAARDLIDAVEAAARGDSAVVF